MKLSQKTPVQKFNGGLSLFLIVIVISDLVSGVNTAMEWVGVIGLTVVVVSGLLTFFRTPRPIGQHRQSKRDRK